MQKVFIKSYGCQMNVYDTERLYDIFWKVGYCRTDTVSDADCIILNTCNIREKAAEKVYSELGRLKPLKRQAQSEGRRLLIGVAGCVAQAEGLELLRRAPVVDIVVGPQSYQRMPRLVAEVLSGKKTAIDITFSPETKFDEIAKVDRPTEGVSSFLTVQEGCDKFCTFCVVPYTRGVEYSRPADQVLAEAQALAGRGAREITLLGQNVNAYHGTGPDGGEWSLAKLIGRIAELPGIERIRYTTSHPLDMDDDLIALHGSLPKLMPFAHLPVQSGSDKVLKAMNRRHTADHYRHLIDRLRHARPDLALSTDIIVGFPGETDDDFKETLRLVSDVGFAQAFSFKYSRRPGTPAADQPQIDDSIKQERLASLQHLFKQQQKAFNDALVGTVQPVLFDGEGRSDGQVVGRTPYMQPTHINAAPGLIGRIEDVLITSAHENSLAGTLNTRVAA